MRLPCYKTEDYEFHCMAYWVFIEPDGAIAHMPTALIEYKCFNCGKIWRKDSGIKPDEILVT